MILKDALLAVKYKTEDRVYAVVNKKFNEPQQSEHVASVSATATYLKVTVTVSTVIVLSVDVRAGSLHARVAWAEPENDIVCWIALFACACV